jgi:hypothetical protein
MTVPQELRERVEIQEARVKTRWPAHHRLLTLDPHNQSPIAGSGHHACSLANNHRKTTAQMLTMTTTIQAVAALGPIKSDENPIE